MGVPRNPDSVWTPTLLNKVLRLGMDPRTAADAHPLLKFLASSILHLPDTVSVSAQVSLISLVFADKEELLGPRFSCPYCRGTLVTPPVRSFVMEDILAVLPKTAEDVEEARSEEGGGHEAEQSNANIIRKMKGKGKQKAATVGDWSRFFGNGLGHGAEGYEAGP